MASSRKEPITINITMSPKELRDLAAKMERTWSKLKLGDPCFVDFLAYKPNDDYVVKLFLDREYFKD